MYLHNNKYYYFLQAKHTYNIATECRVINKKPTTDQIKRQKLHSWASNYLLSYCWWRQRSVHIISAFPAIGAVWPQATNNIVSTLFDNSFLTITLTKHYAARKSTFGYKNRRETNDKIMVVLLNLGIWHYNSPS